jgi:hypothetical protein
MPKSKQTMELIAFQVPSSWKQKLEEYCKVKGYNLSYAIRKAVEDHILTPKFTWEDFLKWKSEVDRWKEMSTKILQEMFEILKEHRQNNIEANEAIINFSQKVLDWMAKTDSQIQTLNVQIEVLFRILEELTGQPIRQILNETVEEWKARKKKETEKET